MNTKFFKLLDKMHRDGCIIYTALTEDSIVFIATSWIYIEENGGNMKVAGTHSWSDITAIRYYLKLREQFNFGNGSYKYISYEELEKISVAKKNKIENVAFTVATNYLYNTDILNRLVDPKTTYVYFNTENPHNLYLHDGAQGYEFILLPVVRAS